MGSLFSPRQRTCVPALFRPYLTQAQMIPVLSSDIQVYDAHQLEFVVFPQILLKISS